MCGLAGMFVPRNVPAPDLSLVRMMAAIRHRGPDGQGTFLSPDKRFQGGFARLAIIDLATGDQPLVDGDGERVMLGNGEIYNYLELRDELRAQGHVFRTNGDMEVALRCYQAKGLDFVDSLNGMYGLAIWERDSHRLVLVRDRLGVKQLYWAPLPGGGLVFASEVKAILASGLIERAVDSAAVAAYLTHGYIPAPATLYQGVHKLPPGHRLVAEADGAIRIERIWRPRASAVGDGDWEHRVAALLGDSVRLQLRSDVPVGALLSGGIDSGLVVALAAEAAERPIETFTVRFEGATYDETPLAAMVAKRYGTRHSEFSVAGDSITDHLADLVWYCDEPLADASLLPNYLIEQQVRERVTVCLNGTGGDELFAGYGRHFPLPIEARYLMFPKAIRQGIVEPLVALADPMAAWRLSRSELRHTDRGGYLNAHCTYFPPPIWARLGCPLPMPEPAQRASFAAFAGPADTAQLAAELETYLPEDLLLLLDRTSMAWGVEGRVPFLDHRLVELALAIPPEQRTPGGRQKGLLREIARNYLPDEVLNAPKRGFASPVPHWMQGPLGVAAAQILTSRRCLARNWWTKAGMAALLADRSRHAFRLYSLLMLELTVRLHVEGDGERLPFAVLADG